MSSYSEVAMTPLADQLDKDPNLMPVTDVLNALGHELERIRSLGFRIEFEVCALALKVDASGGGAQELQQLDLMLQQIGALRDFVSVLANEHGVNGVLQIEPALARIGLADMRARLAGCEWSVASGDAVEMF
jgi:hypothetical protein